MKFCFLLIAAFIILHPAIAQDENADAVFEKLVREYTLHDDGSTSFREFKQLRLLTHLSFNRLYGETFIIYNPHFQKLKINDAYTIMADGKKIVTPENAFNEVLPRNAALSSTANHLREMVVTHTALEVGATIFLDYTLTSARDFIPGLMGTEIIEESSPVKEMEVIIRIPAMIELHHQMSGLRTAPEIQTTGDQKVYTWKFNGLQAAAKESFRGKYLHGAPRLTFSTAGSMDNVVKWLTQQPAFTLSANQQMKKFADSIRSVHDGEIKIMLAIQQEVVNHIAYERYEPSWLGYRFRTPDMVWESNGGSKFEKVLLLAALLRQADFSAEPVMIGSRQFVDPGAGNLSLFNDAAVLVRTKTSGTIYLSAISSENQTLEYGLSHDVIVPLIREKVEVVTPGSDKNMIIFSSDFVFGTDLKPEGQAETELTGIANPFFALLNDKGSLRTFLTGGLLKDSESIRTADSHIHGSKLNLVLESDKAISETSGYYRWTLPSLNTGFDQWRISYLDSRRKDPLVIPYPIAEKYHYSITLPKDYMFVNMDVNQRLECKAGFVSIEFKSKSNKIDIAREIQLHETIISPNDYIAFRNMINAWLDQNHKMVVFKGNQ